MYIEPFKVEIWMNEWENNCTYNLAETCVASITIDTLLQMSGRNSDDLLWRDFRIRAAAPCHRDAL